jgi:hypothetical protein
MRVPWGSRICIPRVGPPAFPEKRELRNGLAITFQAENQKLAGSKVHAHTRRNLSELRCQGGHAHVPVRELKPPARRTTKSIFVMPYIMAKNAHEASASVAAAADLGNAGDDQMAASILLPHPVSGPREPPAAPSGLGKDCVWASKLPGRVTAWGARHPQGTTTRGRQARPLRGPENRFVRIPARRSRVLGKPQARAGGLTNWVSGAWSLPPAQRQPNIVAASACVKSLTLG